MSENTEKNAPDLLNDFPLHSYDEWKTAAEALLKGASFEKKLLTSLHEGITLQPIYRKDDIAGLAHLDDYPGLDSLARGNRASGYRVTPWLISQELDCSTPETFNTVALHALENGQSELNIPLDKAVRAGQDPDHSKVGEVGGHGLSLATVDDLTTALKEVQLEHLPVYFRTGTAALPVSILFWAMAKKRGIPFEKLSGCLEADPLGNLAATGGLAISLDTAWRNIAWLTKFAAANSPKVQTITVQGTPYSNGGATSVQELGYVIATGVEYLRKMQAQGVDPATTAQHMRLALAVGSDFFVEASKLRAARLLWTRVLESFGVDAAATGIHIHARTSRWNKTVYDPYVNMLRTTTEAFSAVIGGCDSLHVSPFDEVIRTSNTFSRRIARNTQIILAEECDLAQVIDPAGGSYYVEWLTDQVARKAWAVFQEIEAAGGMSQALADGLPQKAIAASATKKAKHIAQRRDVFVGTNQYANAMEETLEVTQPDYEAIFRDRAATVTAHRKAQDTATRQSAREAFATAIQNKPENVIAAGIEAVLAGATLGEVTRTLWNGETSFAHIIAVPSRRGAEDFEDLRNAADAHYTHTGTRPQILQANIGASRGYRMRADWTTGFFEVGGFEVRNDRDFSSPDEVIAAAKESGAKIVVITSSDATYAETVPALAKGLKELDSGIYVLVAGAPNDSETDWRNAGVDAFVNVRVNNYTMLKTLLEHLDLAISH